MLACLLVPPAERGHLILDAICALLCMPRLTNERRDLAASLQSSALSTSKDATTYPDLRSHTAIITLHVLIECGLLDVLNASAAAAPTLTQRLSELLRELLTLTASHPLLPQRIRLKLHQLSELTNRAVDLHAPPPPLSDEPSLVKAYSNAVATATTAADAALPHARNTTSSNDAAAVPMPHAPKAAEAHTLSGVLRHTALQPGATASAASTSAVGRVLPLAQSEALVAELLADLPPPSNGVAPPSSSSTPPHGPRGSSMAEAGLYPREWRQSGLVHLLKSSGAVESDGLIGVARSRIDSLRLEEGYAIEETDLTKLVRECGVLSSKFYLRDWDWLRIEALVDGPLRYDAKLERLLRTSPKWFKRQLSMLRPEKDCFAVERLDEPYAAILIRVCSKLIKLLLSSDEGADFLGAHLIAQLAIAVQAYLLGAHGLEVGDDLSSRPQRTNSIEMGSTVAKLTRQASSGGMSPTPSPGGLFGRIGRQASGRLRHKTNETSRYTAPHDSDEEEDASGASAPTTPQHYGRGSHHFGSSSHSSSSAAVATIQGSSGSSGALPVGPSPRYQPERLLSEGDPYSIRSHASILASLAFCPHHRGRLLLQRHKIWPLLAALCRIRERPDLALHTMHALSYARLPPPSSSPEGEVDHQAIAVCEATEARRILTICLDEHEAISVRRAAASNLSVLASARLDGFSRWGLEAFRNATFDPDSTVRHEAVCGLLKACEQPELLSRLVSMHAEGALTLELICRDSPPEEALATGMAASAISPPKLQPTSTRSPSSTSSSPDASVRSTRSTRTSIGGANFAPPPAPPPEAATPTTTPATSPTIRPWSVSTGYKLLLRLARHPEGLDALIASGWLHRELPQCATTALVVSVADNKPAADDAPIADRFVESGGKAEAYTLGIESQLAEALHAMDHGGNNGHGEVGGEGSGVPMPPHLFGALGTTTKGRSLLATSGVLDTHMRLLSSAPPHTAKGGAAAVPVTCLTQRSALWAAAHVGASDGGFEWLVGRYPSLVPNIDRIARHSPILSLRGTAIACLGLIGGSGDAAREALEGCGWVCPGVDGSFVALPKEGTTFLRIETSDASAPSAAAVVPPPTPLAPPPIPSRVLPPVPPPPAPPPVAAAAIDHSAAISNSIRLEAFAEGDDELLAVLSPLIDLINPVKVSASITKLKELRESGSAAFSKRGLFLAAHELLARHRVPLPIRKQIHIIVAKAASEFEPPEERAQVLAAEGAEEAAPAPPPPPPMPVKPVLNRRYSDHI